MLVLSTKPLQKLTGTGGQTGRLADRRTDNPMCREAAPPKNHDGNELKRSLEKPSGNCLRAHVIQNSWQVFHSFFLLLLLFPPGGAVGEGEVHF